MREDLDRLDTEQENPLTAHIDEMSTMDMVRAINREDRRCAEAVERTLPEIAQAVDLIAARLQAGGRLYYMGAGTSGRLGVLDAAECPPTFGTSPELVTGLIAGGRTALTEAVEGAEDDSAAGEREVDAHGMGPGDVLVGIAASGRTPYVLGGMARAKARGADVVAVVCVQNSAMAALADITIAPLPGPEVIAGSSRMKAGTCQKMVLNMLSTGAMIRLGKVYGNLMADVKATNEKLAARAVRIVTAATGASEQAARRALEACDMQCKPAIVMLLLGCTRKDALEALERAGGHIAQAIKP